MRIISGSHKGRQIVAPKNLPVRPTTDFAKEALFNILENSVCWEDTPVWDLFAGTGNMSFEFASRSCPSVLAVDQHPACYRFIREQALKMPFPQLLAVKSEVLQFIKHTPLTARLIFADPPYDMPNIPEIHQAIVGKPEFNPSIRLIIEHGSKTDLSSLAGFKQTRRYGNVHFSFFFGEE